MTLEERMKKVEQQVHARDAVRSKEARARRRVALPLGALAFMAWLSIPWIAIQWHYYNLSPLQRAAYDGDYVECERLVKAGAPIDATDDAGQTALYYAAWHGHIDATRTLIALGADVNKRDLSGKTLLYKFETITDHGRPRGTPEQRAKIAELLRSHGAAHGPRSPANDRHRDGIDHDTERVQLHSTLPIRRDDRMNKAQAGRVELLT